MAEPKVDPKKKGGAAGTQGQATIAEAEGAAALLTGGAATSSGSRGSIPLGLFGAIPPSIQSIEEEDLSDPIVMFSKAMNTNMKDKEQFVENMYKLSGSMQELMIYDEPTVRRCLERMFENGIESVKDVLKMKQKITNVFIVPEKDRTDDTEHLAGVAGTITTTFDRWFKTLCKRQQAQRERTPEKKRKERDEDESSDGPADKKTMKKENKKEKSKKKKKRKRSASTSSASFSSEDRAEKFRDVESMIRQHHLELFGSSLPEHKLIAEAHRRRDQKYISSKPIELWYPNGLGSDLDRETQDNMKRARMKSKNLLIAELIEHVVAFWLTHSILGIVRIDSILAHVMVIANVANRSQPEAVKDERQLILFLRGKMISGDIQTVDEYLIKEVSEIVLKSATNSFSGKRIDLRPGDPLNRDTRQPSGGKGANKGQAEMIRTMQNMQNMISQLARTGSGGGGKGRDRDPPRTNDRDRDRENTGNRRSIPCKFYNTNTGDGCSKGDQCPFLHAAQDRRSHRGSNGQDRSRGDGKNKGRGHQNNSRTGGGR